MGKKTVADRKEAWRKAKQVQEYASRCLLCSGCVVPCID